MTLILILLIDLINSSVFISHIFNYLNYSALPKAK
jgi:hypothetical protein